MKIQYQDSNLIVFESSLFRTTSSLIIDNDYILLVDPNWLPIEIDFIAEWIDTHTKEKKKYLLFTHSDYDHIIGYKKFEGYKTIASLNFTRNNSKKSILDQIKAFDDSNYIGRDYAINYPEIDLIISDEIQHELIESDNFIFYQARGHNQDGIITFNKSKNILIVGDYLSNIEFPYIYDSFEFYKNTLKTLENIIEKEEVKFLITGHGDYASDKEEMHLRIKDSRKYIEDLEYAIKNDSPFDMKHLFETYQFPNIMTKFHEGNIKLLKEELKEG